MDLDPQRGPFFGSARQRWWAGILFGFWSVSLGCVSLDNPASVQRLARVASIGTSETVVLKRVRPTPLEQMKRMLYQRPPDPSPRNQQILRRYALLKTFQKDRTEAIDRLWELSEVEDNAELVASVSLLSLGEAQHHQRYARTQAALDWYVMSLVSAGNYLWSPRLSHTRNPYDPNFAEVTAAYNESLEHVLRYLRVERGFRGEKPELISTRLFDLNLDCQILGHWDEQEFEKLEFVSDFDIQGLTNHHRQYGLGVPLIAIRAERTNSPSPSEKFYPPNLTLPVTAFLRLPLDARVYGAGRPKIRASIEMIDPLRQSTIRVGQYESPLATDLTAPLAYYLNDPLYRSNLLATASLLNADLGREIRGLYMLEPYDPAKIPVVMVHGFWSSATTWTEMFNDLRANPVLNQRYQFWFYMYPTGQPFWVSAKQMREDLAEVRQTLDPQRQSLALDQMVLVGHSMGGLISYLQTIDSGDHFWRLLSEEPFESLRGDPQAIAELQSTLFFTPNPDIKRVVTMAVPFQGSDFANPTTRWLGRSLLKLPQLLVKGNTDLVKENPNFFRDADLLTIETSIDSLASDSPFFVALNQARPAPWTRYHNLIGRYQPSNAYQRWQQSYWGEGDGVVDVESAQFPYAHSSDEVDGRHMTIHQSARSIWVVRQVLLQHLAEVGTQQVPNDYFQPGPLLASDSKSPLGKSPRENSSQGQALRESSTQDRFLRSASWEPPPPRDSPRRRLLTSEPGTPAALKSESLAQESAVRPESSAQAIAGHAAEGPGPKFMPAIFKGELPR
jgi:hypothetical protein